MCSGNGEGRKTRVVALRVFNAETRYQLIAMLPPLSLGAKPENEELAAMDERAAELSHRLKEDVARTGVLKLCSSHADMVHGINAVTEVKLERVRAILRSLAHACMQPDAALHGVP